tara:strand:+ start:553 stop:1812 length:1260 start_codon:yes stop_codon:yes gene_type:complete
MPKNKDKLDKINIYFFSVLYASLLFGFGFDENLNLGSKPDWYGGNFPAIRDFSENFYKTFLNYDNYNHRHSPVYLIFLSFFSRAGIDFDVIRFLHLNISIILIFLFYKCLTIKFKSADKNILFLLSISIFLSPTFRSLSIWPDSRIIGLIFFTLSVYEFLKFDQKKNIKYYYKTIFYLILSSYISPNFSVFIIFYYFYFFNKLVIKHIYYSFLFCLACSLPALYYLFILEVNFLIAHTPGASLEKKVSLDFNFSNKVLIISSIILFHLSPFLINKKFLKEIIKFSKKNFIIVLIFLSLNIYFFDYLIAFTGGGIFFQISNFIFNNNIIFYFFSFLSLLVIFYFFRYNIYNVILYSILVLSNIQNTIYHKYYDPLIMIIFFLMTAHFLPERFISIKKNLVILYMFYFIFILARIFKISFF